MVYYFTSTVVDPSAFIYVGKDKFENEELIKYGWEEDVWYVVIACLTSFFSCTVLTSHRFHVDKLSSAHIYLRLPEQSSDDAAAQQQQQMTWDAIPAPLLADLAQLTKANSIEGNKKDNVTVIYTPWSNLKKDGSMEVGQVSFKDPRKVKKVLVPQRENPVVNRLNKTRVERKPDLKQERDERLKELRKRDQAASLLRKKEEARIMQERKEKKWQKDHAYDELFAEHNMEESSNQNRDADWEDDFM